MTSVQLRERVDSELGVFVHRLGDLLSAWTRGTRSWGSDFLWKNSLSVPLNCTFLWYVGVCSSYLELAY